MPQRLRIFVSSPADVPNERLRADLIVDKLSQDYGRFFAIESYRWEHEAMIASAHFQDAIEPPSAFDIVVLILWSRLGTQLPEKTAEREYRGIDGRAPVTGTEWEYEEALKVAREKKAPDLLAFRNISPAPIDPRDASAQAASLAQLGALNAFWTRHFADRGVFLTAYDEYRTLEEFAQRLEGSLRKLIERRIRDLSGSGAASTAAVWTGDPFRGLESYEFEHAPIFFGRDAAVTKATEQLAANARDGHAFLLVSGASGSGKSSLVKAGVVPRLMKPQRISGMAFLRRAVFRPGSEGIDSILGLSKALTSAGGKDVGLPELIAPGQDATKLATHLCGALSEPGYLFTNALGRLTAAERQSGRLLAFEDAKLILVVDQLEELFVPGIGPDDRRLFIQLLAGLAHSGAVWVIATLRADFWHRAAEIPELVALAEGQGRIDLAAPLGPELAEMIRRPAQAAGLSFEAHPESGLGLDGVLADDAAAAPGVLPLLSFTLDELYKNAKARGEAILTHASYEALGGLEGAIAKRADEIMVGLPSSAQAALARVLRALTTVTGAADQAPVARPAQLQSFPVSSPARILMDAFIAARLLVAASEGGTSPTVRLAHEALISRWKRARDQLTSDRRDLETRTLIERQFQRWSQANGRERPLLLLRNPDLANALDLAGRWGDDLSVELRSFVALSDATMKAATRRRWAVAAVVMVCLAGLTAASVGAFIAAEHQRNDALIVQSKFLARDARSATADGNPTLGALLALAAMPGNLSAPDRPFIKEAGFALEDALDNERERAFIAVDPPPGGLYGDDLNVAAMSPDGSKIATGTADKLARIWDGRTGKQLLALAHDDTVQLVAFSSDGKRLITAAASSGCLHCDGTSWHVWDADTGREILKLVNQADGFPVFLPGLQRVITAVKGSPIELREATTGATIATLDQTDRADAIFSRDGAKILISSRNGKTQLSQRSP